MWQPCLFCNGKEQFTTAVGMADVAKAAGVAGWRTPLVWGPVMAMGVVIVVLVALVAVYAAQGTADGHSLTMSAMGPPLVGGTSAAITLVDTSDATVSFVGQAVPVKPGASSAVPIPRVTRSGSGSGSGTGSVTQVDVQGLQPNTAYVATIRSLGKSGSPTGHKDLVVPFTTAAAVVPGPVTGMFVKDVTAANPNLEPGWSMLMVGCDPLPVPPAFKTEQIAYAITVQGVGMFIPFSLLYNSLSGGTPIKVPSGLPVTVAIQPIVSDVAYGTPFYSSSNYAVGGCVLPMGPVVVSAPVVGQTPAAGPAKFFNDPAIGVPSCTLPNS